MKALRTLRLQMHKNQPQAMNTQVRDFKSQPKREKEIEKLPITEKKARLQKIQIKKNNNIYNSSPVKIIKHISKKLLLKIQL
jgi:hypothetical protein